MCAQIEILLIDDEASWLETLSDLLKRWGFSVKGVSNGVDAIRVFLEEYVGLVITDYEMPRMNGIELTRSLRNLSATVPIIMMSGDETETTAYYARQVGVDAHIHKSADPEEIRKCIETVLSRLASASRKKRIRIP